MGVSVKVGEGLGGGGVSVPVVVGIRVDFGVLVERLLAAENLVESNNVVAAIADWRKPAKSEAGIKTNRIFFILHLPMV